MQDHAHIGKFAGQRVVPIAKEDVAVGGSRRHVGAHLTPGARGHNIGQIGPIRGVFSSGERSPKFGHTVTNAIADRTQMGYRGFDGAEPLIIRKEHSESLQPNLHTLRVWSTVNHLLGTNAPEPLPRWRRRRPQSARAQLEPRASIRSARAKPSISLADLDPASSPAA